MRLIRREYKTRGPQRYRPRRLSHLALALKSRHFLTDRSSSTTSSNRESCLLCRGQLLSLPTHLSYPLLSPPRCPPSRHPWPRLSRTSLATTPSPNSLHHRVYLSFRSVANSPLTSPYPLPQPFPLLLAILYPGPQMIRAQNKRRLPRRRSLACRVNLTKDDKEFSPPRPFVSLCLILRVPSYSRRYRRNFVTMSL